MRRIIVIAIVVLSLVFAGGRVTATDTPEQLMEAICEMALLACENVDDLEKIYIRSRKTTRISCSMDHPSATILCDASKPVSASIEGLIAPMQTLCNFKSHCVSP